MKTDWLVVRRLAAELDAAVRSARIRDVGLTGDGRFALRVRARGAGGDALLIDAFGDTPIVTLEHADETTASPGWSRSIAEATRGMRIERVRARRGDRLIAIDVATVSRFGVLSSYQIVAELVPRFGNVLLLKGEVIVAAAREFGADRNPRRPIEVGEAYRPPPLPEPTASLPEVTEAVRRLIADRAPDAQRATARTLHAHLPLVPQLVADSLVLQASQAEERSAEALARRLVDDATELLSGTEGEDAHSAPVYVYRDAGRIVAAHVLPLHQFAHLTVQRPVSLLEAIGESAGAERLARDSNAAETRQKSLLARLRRRRDGLEQERGSLESSLAEAASPEDLRKQGDLLYAHHAEVPAGASVFSPPGAPKITIPLDPELDAKANAAAIFKRYRKALGRREHAARRLEDLAAQVRAADELAWEIERADLATLDELSEDVDRIDPRARPGRGRAQPRRSALEVAVADDARILVGRSPRNNAELTFRIAKPEDLWFHARGVPGAHVVLRIDSARDPTSAELRSAAELAAYHSKARTSGVVPVDYTPRKYVRKQQDALPGLVWYTNAKTIDVTPRPIDSAR